jgi:peptide chain release factor 1
MIPAAKLERLLDRFAAIESEMASGASGPAFVKLSREHAELAPVIESARARKQAQNQLDGAEALIADPATDSEMRGLAEQERAELREQLARLDDELKIQLLPRDAADASSAIVEIRRG